jgi:hypothetical protein
MTINLQVKRQDGHLVQIARGAEIPFDVITQGVVSLVDNFRKGTVEAITYTIVDTKVVIEVTTTECVVTGRLAKSERIARVCSEYLEKLKTCEWPPHVVEATTRTYNLILEQELNKVAGTLKIEEVDFVYKS